MAAYRRRSRASSILIVVVLVAITLIVLDSRGSGGPVGSVRNGLSDAFSPLQRGTHAALAPVGNFLQGAADYGSLRAQNQKLRNQVAAMQAQAVAAASSEAAADQVLAQAHLPYGTGPTATARVIDEGSSNFENTVTIDKGTHQGIALNQPVIAPGGLVGDVAAATPNTAIVDLLSNPTFVVGVNLGGNVIGSAQGTGRNAPLRVTFDESPGAGFKLTPGQVIASSGESLEAIPSGIPVARVKSVSTSPSSIEPVVTLTPVVNLSDLSYVTVVLGAAQ